MLCHAPPPATTAGPPAATQSARGWLTASSLPFPACLQQLLASAGQNKQPIVDLWPPTQTQAMGLSYLGNNTLACYLS